VGNALRALRDLGQSVWLDGVRRSQLEPGGYLASRVEADEVDGLTSNLAVLAQALATDDAYGAALRERRGAEPREALRQIVEHDVRAACDRLLPVHEASGGARGLVSVDLDPTRAVDTEEIVSEALLLAAEVDRPNVMVKVPGTESGTAALPRLLAEGVHVDVILLCSVGRYERVLDAYLDGLRRRADAGRPLGAVRSVASFLVSPVDVEVDVALGETHALLATAAIANARIAYRAFERAVAAPAFAELAHAGAAAQRLLWTATAAQNPALRDVVYVEELAGPDTVTALAETTLAAVRERAHIEDRLSGAGDEAQAQLRRLAEEGVDLAAVTAGLEADGVEHLVVSFESAVAAVERHVAA
jgi:transaldolase